MTHSASKAFSLLKKFLIGACVLQAAVHAVPGMAQAPESFPSRPVRLVVGFPAGGAADVQARVLASKLAETLGQQVIVDNKPGAGSNIGAELVAKSKPDGYTLLLAPSAALAINPWLYSRMSFDPQRDFAFIGQFTSFQGLVAVSAGAPFKTLKDLVSFARAQPGKLVFGSPGNGTTPHLAAELFKSVAHIDMVHASYRGDAAALTDAMAGQTPVVFVNMASALPLIKAGRLRALAVTGKQRALSLPDVPTIEEAGFPGSAVTGWSGLAAPAGTPEAIVTRLSNALKLAVASADLREKLAQQAAEPYFSTPVAFAAFVSEERKRFGKVIRDAQITVD
ncbi:MAG: tripartite tricarboxylate transporter substrate binding protein [Pseudomonadota bacterium]